MRLIDADAVINELNNSHYPGAPYVDAGISIAIGKVCDAPTIEPERKTGHWIFHETQNDRYDDMTCPFCKKTYTVDAYRIDDIGFTAEDFNYCPNCGAKMEVDECQK